MQILVRRVSEKPNFKVRKPRDPKFIRMSFPQKILKWFMKEKAKSTIRINSPGAPRKDECRRIFA